MYHKARNGHQLKALNDLRQLTRINKSLNESQIAEITDDIIEVAKQRRRERIAQQEQEAQRNLKNKLWWIYKLQQKRDQRFSNYMARAKPKT